MTTQTQSLTSKQIDKRAVISIIRAIEKRRSFVVRYGDIYDELRKLVENDDEFHEIENKLYEAIDDGRIENVYRFWGTCDDSEYDVVIVSPRRLSDSALKIIIEKLTHLYRFKGYDGDKDGREELTRTIHNLVKMWNSECTNMSSPAEAAYMLAKRYGLKIDEDSWHADKIYYTVEGLNKRIVKSRWHCNNCLDFSMGNSLLIDNLIEKCKSWHFEDDED